MLALIARWNHNVSLASTALLNDCPGGLRHPVSPRHMYHTRYRCRPRPTTT